MPTPATTKVSTKVSTKTGTDASLRRQLLLRVGLLTDADVALMLGVTTEHLRRHRAEGPTCVRLGRSLYYREGAIVEWLTQIDGLQNTGAIISKGTLNGNVPDFDAVPPEPDQEP